MDGRTAVLSVEAATARSIGGDPTAPLAGGWAAAVTAGMSMAGVRAAFTSSRNLAAIHESLYADAGKRLTYVLHVESRAATKQAPSRNAGHDDYHAVDDTGLFQLFAHDTQSAADLGVIAHRIAELALTPGLVARDTGYTIQSVRLPEPACIEAYLGDPADLIDSPTPAQRLVYGARRRRVPEHFDLDYPAMLGAAQNPHSYAQGVAAQRPFYFDHVAELTDRAFAEFAELTGRAYARIGGHLLDGAEYLLVAQGSVVPIAEAVCDRLRATRRIRVGVLNITMFRPFPADLLSRLLAGRKGVTVLERVDQPLAADPPLLREIRATMSRAVENGHAGKALPHAGITACRGADVPTFYAGCYGLGGRDIQAGDLVAVVDNMAARAPGRRHFYLGIDFVQPGTRFPKQQVWQDQLVDSYPELADLALARGPAMNLLPADAVAARFHGLDSADAMVTAARAVVAVADVLGLHLQACPRPATAAGGALVSLDACFAREGPRVSPGGDVTVALAPSGPAFAASKPLDDLVDTGVLVVEGEGSPEDTWRRLPAAARRAIVEKRHRVYALDVSNIAGEAASPSRDRMRSAAFVGALCRVSGLAERAQLSEGALIERLRARLATDTGEPAPDEHLNAVRRGFSALVELTPGAYAAVVEEGVGPLPVMPAILGGTNVRPGIAHGGRFWEQVGVLNTLGQEGLADPFAALGAIPAATSAIRDMTAVRTDVPAFIPDRCTGCGACWVQCPDTAIPGVVSDVADLLAAAIKTVEADRRCDRLRQIVKPLSSEVRRLVKAGPFPSFAAIVATAYGTVADKLGLDGERREALDGEFQAVHAALTDFPVARTDRFFDAHERKAKGTGGLLSVTIDPVACRGCSICVEACVDGALRPVAQTDTVVETLRRNWALWQHLPETDDRYVEDGGDAVGSLLLKQSIYQSMVGGDVVTPGAAEKAALHLVLSAVNAFVRPRARAHVRRLTELIDGLDQKARQLLASDAPLDKADALGAMSDGKLAIPLEGSKHKQVEWIARIIGEVTDLRWRYVEGPGGKGRATCGMTNDGSSTWGSTYPFNPYPFPWASHLLEDAPSVAIGIFEGQMRKMARGFGWVRRAELELSGEYDPQEHEPQLAALDWRRFTDDEFALCPPVLAVGSVQTMLERGFHNLSRLLASDHPVRVVVFDTPGSTDGHDAVRRDVTLLAMAHRHAFVLQSSQATPSHLVAGVMRGLAARGPALFALPCSAAPARAARGSTLTRAARLALESRAHPALLYDPAAGPSVCERLSLEGNPSPDQAWPAYDFAYVDDGGASHVITLPVTVADWAATEPAFAHHFKDPGEDTPDDTLMRFDEYLAAPPAARAGMTPFIYVLGDDRHPRRRVVSAAIVALAEERLQLWRHLRQLAGYDLPEPVRARVTAPVEAELERRLKELESQHRARIADLESRYPALIARRLVEGLIRAAGNGTETIGELLRRAAAMPGVEPIRLAPDGEGSGHGLAAPSSTTALPPPAADLAAAATPPRAAAEPDVADESLTMDPYIQSELCTSCDECININKRMFAYNKQKQAYIKDVKAGTFRQLVMAAQKCPVAVIHPGTPLNSDEPDLAKWVEQAARFQ